MTTNSKLVFIDIDGTLADENHVVPESAKIACKQAQANGHKLFICTGRSVPKIERSILDLGFDGVVSVAVVPEKLRTLDRGRPWRDSQFASTRLSPSRDMSR